MNKELIKKVPRIEGRCISCQSIALSIESDDFGFRRYYCPNNDCENHKGVVVNEPYVCEKTVPFINFKAKPVNKKDTLILFTLDFSCNSDIEGISEQNIWDATEEYIKANYGAVPLVFEDSNTFTDISSEIYISADDVVGYVYCTDASNKSVTGVIRYEYINLIDPDLYHVSCKGIVANDPVRILINKLCITKNEEDKNMKTNVIKASNDEERTLKDILDKKDPELSTVLAHVYLHDNDGLYRVSDDSSLYRTDRKHLSIVFQSDCISALSEYVKNNYFDYIDKFTNDDYVKAADMIPHMVLNVVPCFTCFVDGHLVINTVNGLYDINSSEIVGESKPIISCDGSMVGFEYIFTNTLDEIRDAISKNRETFNRFIYGKIDCVNPADFIYGEYDINNLFLHLSECENYEIDSNEDDD